MNFDHFPRNYFEQAPYEQFLAIANWYDRQPLLRKGEDPRLIETLNAETTEFDKTTIFAALVTPFKSVSPDEIGGYLSVIFEKLSESKAVGLLRVYSFIAAERYPGYEHVKALQHVLRNDFLHSVFSPAPIPLANGRKAAVYKSLEDLTEVSSAYPEILCKWAALVFPDSDYAELVEISFTRVYKYWYRNFYSGDMGRDKILTFLTSDPQKFEYLSNCLVRITHLDTEYLGDFDDPFVVQAYDLFAALVTAAATPDYAPSEYKDPRLPWQIVHDFLQNAES